MEDSIKVYGNMDEVMRKWLIELTSNTHTHTHTRARAHTMDGWMDGWKEGRKIER
jgi:hypothetical protein